MDLIALFDGRTLQVHEAGDCRLEHCCIHNPSQWALSEAPLNWRDDRSLMERVCRHGVGHPDLDDLAFKRAMLDEVTYKGYAFESHGCDGCCIGINNKEEL